MRRLAAGLLLFIPFVAAAQEYKIAYASQKGVFVMTPRGRDATRIADDPAVILNEHAWSPDGRRILFFVYRKQDASLEYKYNLPFHFPMYVMDADGKNQKRLLEFPVLIDAKWSPDGRSILFTSSFEGDSRRRGIYVFDVATGTYRRVTDLAFNRFASWSPDGRTIVFTSGTRPREVYAVNADGSNLRQLTNLGMVATNPVWSPDGRTIAFAAEGWFIMDADGRNKKRVDPLGGSVSLAWSPDSKHVVATSGGGGYVWNADGSKAVMLPTREGRILDCAFSPDGKRVLYRAHEGLNDKIYIINVDGSDWRTVSDNVGERLLFAVSPLIK